MLTKLKFITIALLFQAFTAGFALSQDTNTESPQKRANEEFIEKYFSSNKLDEAYSTSLPRGFNHFEGNFNHQRVFDGFVYYLEGTSLKRFPLSSWGLAIDGERKNLLETVYDFGTDEKTQLIDYGFSEEQKILYVFLTNQTKKSLIKLDFSDEKSPIITAVDTIRKNLDTQNIKSIKFLKDDQWLVFKGDVQNKSDTIYDFNNDLDKVVAKFTSHDFAMTDDDKTAPASFVPVTYTSASGKNHLIVSNANVKRTTNNYYYFSKDDHHFYPLPGSVQLVYGVVSDSHIIALALLPREGDPSLFDSHLIAFPISNILQQANTEPVQFLFSEGSKGNEQKYLNFYDINVSGDLVTWLVFEHGISGELYVAKSMENPNGTRSLGVANLMQEQIFPNVKTNIVAKLFKDGEVSDINYKRGLFVRAIEPHSNQILVESLSLDIDYFLMKVRVDEVGIGPEIVSTPYKSSNITFEKNDEEVIVMRIEIPTDLGTSDAYLVMEKNKWDQIQNERLNDGSFNGQIPTIIEMNGIDPLRLHRQKQQYFSNWIQHGGAYVLLHASGGLEHGFNFSSMGKYGSDMTHNIQELENLYNILGDLGVSEPAKIGVSASGRYGNLLGEFINQFSPIKPKALVVTDGYPQNYKINDLDNQTAVLLLDTAGFATDFYTSVYQGLKPYNENFYSFSRLVEPQPKRVRFLAGSIRLDSLVESITFFQIELGLTFETFIDKVQSGKLKFVSEEQNP